MEKNSKNKSTKEDYVHAVGRRREAVARIRLYKEVKEPIMWGEQQVKKGEIFVNGKIISDYFPGDVAKIKYEEPLRVANVLGEFTITIVVSGGGKSGQLDAVVHGISHALAKYSKNYRVSLKKKGFLTRDPRARERRKVGMGGKARRKRQSPKR